MSKSIASLSGSSVAVLLCGVFVAIVCGACAEAGGHEQPSPPSKIQSVTLDARQAPSPSVMVGLHEMGVTHVTLIQFAFQPGHDVPEVRMHTDASWFSESDRGIRSLSRQADSLGLQLILKPHIWLSRANSDGRTRADIGFETEAAWAQWEAQYHSFMMHYAHLAEDIDAAMLVVGTELAHAARTRPDFWRRLIADVRAVYGGA